MKTGMSKNKMGIVPINKLMLSMGVPMIISMMLQAFYNIVDSYFVSAMKDTAEISGMGEYGVTALTLAFPIQMLMIAIGVGTGVGVNALLSRYLGQGDRERASKIAGNAVFVSICTYAVFLFVGLFLVKPYLRSQTSDPIVLKMGIDYLTICTVLSFGSILFMIYEKLLQSTGKTMHSTIAQIVGAVTNIILDPIMIFGYLGCPVLGIKGAAYATVIGQVVSLLCSAFFHYRYNKDVDSGIRYLKPDKSVIKDIYIIGIPAIVMQALMSFMTYGINIIFGRISTAAVTAYGIYYKIQQFIFFAAFGLNNAIIPIVSFNYGMQNKQRVKEGVKYGMMYSLIIMLIGAAGLQVFAVPLVKVFSLSERTGELCLVAIRIITLGYLFVGANIAFQGIFQAFGNGIRSLIVSMIRLIVVTLPLAYVLTMFQNAEDIVWWAFPAAEACAFAAAFFLMKGIAKDKINKIKE